MTAPNSNFSNPESTPGAMLEAEPRAQLGHQLRAVYVDVVNEPVPEKFVRLLEELERKHPNGS